MYLKIDTQFNPLTYEDLVKPIVDYEKAYKEVEDAYSTLAEQTDAFSNIINQSNSPDAYNMYKEYSDALNTAIDDFSQGMTIGNRAKLLKMKRDYAKNILPIAAASEAMKEANNIRYKAGPDAIFEVSSYDSLDDFLGGKVANNRYQSASAITAKTAAMTEAVMKEALQDPDFKKIMDNQQYMITQHNGGSYEDLMAAIANNPVAQNKFVEIKQQIMKDSGYNNFDIYGKAAIESAINAGLYAGLDKPVRQFEANRNHLTPELLERQRQFEIELKTKGYDKDGNVDPNSPYWRLQGLEYDSTNKTWKVVGKPGTTKPGDKSSSGDRVPVYNDIITVSRDGTRKIGLASGETIKGERVKVDVKNGTYSIKIGNLTLGTYNPKTDTFTGGIDINKRKDENVTKVLGHTYDNDVDDLNVQRLLKDIANVASKTGDNSLNNYNFYIDLDNAKGSSNDGGYSIEPLYRGMLTPFDSSDGGVDLNIN